MGHSGISFEPVKALIRGLNHYPNCPHFSDHLEYSTTEPFNQRELVCALFGAFSQLGAAMQWQQKPCFKTVHLFASDKYGQYGKNLYLILHKHAGPLTPNLWLATHGS